MKSKKTITITISIILIAACIGTVYAAVTNGTIPLQSTTAKPESVSDAAYRNEDKPTEYAKPEKIVMVDSQEKNLIHKSSRMIIADQKENEVNKSNFAKNEIKQLLEEGYDVKDILEADVLCNKIHEKPSVLLKRKKAENIEWKALEDKIKSERRDKNLEKLIQKYPDQKKKLAAGNLSDDEQYMLLAFIDLNEVSSVDNLIQEYKKGGQANLAKLIKPKKDKEVR